MEKKIKYCALCGHKLIKTPKQPAGFDQHTGKQKYIYYLQCEQLSDFLKQEVEDIKAIREENGGWLGYYMRLSSFHTNKSVSE